MHSQLLQAFSAFAADPRADELTALILINQLLFPDLNTAALRSSLNELESAYRPPQPPWRFLAEQGFSGNVDDYGSLENSRLDRLLETRRGIPISLAVLLIHLARQAGLAADGINFPGHFLVRVDGRLIDPFQMEETTEAACLAGLPESAPRGAGAFDVAGPPAILLRMLNNLKFAFVGATAWDRALDVLDAQLALAPEEPALHLERGEYWSRLGVISSARDAFAEAERLSAGGMDPRLVEIGRVARDRLRGLAGENDVLH